jgi:hypothetical protein
MVKPDHLEQWVNQRMVASDPVTEWPDRAAGWTSLNRRLAAPPRRAWLWAGATAALCAAVLALPGSRVVAQQLWDQVVLGRVQVWVMDYDRHGAAASVFTPELRQRPEARPAASLEEAIDRAGFSPRLPGLDVFSIAPTYSVADLTTATLRLRAPAMRYLVAQAGGAASEVPRVWDGVVLDVRVGPVIIADYDGVLLLQSLPFELVKPANFDLELFYRIAFQSLGMNDLRARSVGADLGFSPALLMVMPREDRELLREFTTKSGRGVMIDEVYGPGKIVAVWSGSDRLYALFPDTKNVSREFVIQVANALD